MSAEECTRPPAGWRCTRGPHLSQEPCAAVPEHGRWRLVDAVLWLMGKCGSRGAREILALDAQREKAMDRWFR